MLTRVADSTGALIPGMWHFTCPGCEADHAIYTEGYPHPGPCWTFNGDLVKPTFSPSLLVRWDFGEKREPKVCHSFIRGGNIEFLNDCTHSLAGKTVPLPRADE